MKLATGTETGIFLFDLRAVVLSLLLTGCGTLQEAGPAGFDEATLSRWLDQQRHQHALPALGVVLLDNENVLALAVSGLRSIAHDVPVELDDRWHLGSISKSMTATLAAILVDEGLIQFEDSVANWLLPDYPDMHADYHAVSLAALLRHQGGLPEELQGLPLWQHMDIRDTPAPQQRQKLLDTLLAHAPTTAPGGFLYSNAGYVLAATMLEVAAGQDWETLIEQRLFKPLGLNSAGIGAPGQSQSLPDQPWGHRSAEPLVSLPPGPFADHPSALAPAGRVHMSLADLAAYLRLHLQVASAEDLSVPMPAQAIGLLHETADDNWAAAGWFKEAVTWTDTAVLTHSGSNTFWHALVQIAPAEGLALAVVTNALAPDLEALERIAHLLASGWQSAL